MKMMLVKWFFLLVVIPAIEGSLRLWPAKDSSVEERVTKKILETCYGDNDSKDLIFILGDFNEFFDKASVIRMNYLSSIDEDYESRQWSSIAGIKVLIVEDLPEELHPKLILFKKTRWWNHRLSFFIVAKNDEKCENFKDILNTTWRMDKLNSIYICSESESTTLYTLNPITNYAPDSWRRMGNLNDLNIYHQIFDLHVSCNNLNYDKTKILNGYQIKALCLFHGNDCSEYGSHGILINTLDRPHKFSLFHIVIRQLNASVEYEGVYENFTESDKDVTLYAFTIKDWTQVSNLFPVREHREVVIVKPNEKTVLYKIRHLWSTQVLCGATIALIILFFILVMKNGEITLAILDIIRFITFVSIRTGTRSNLFRIYFTTMLIFIVISNGVFQGKIAAFLTKPDKVPPVKTMEELEDLGYNFYVPWWLELRPAKGHITELDDQDECILYVLDGTHNACIISLDDYERDPQLKDLDRIRPRFEEVRIYNWYSRRNWPLYERFNYILMQSIESGILVHWNNRRHYRAKDKRQADAHELALAEIVPSYRPIELVKLDFAFKLLAIGLLFATFVLIVELRMREI